MTSTSKSNPGHFFEDFFVGMPLAHATPQTLTEGDIGILLGQPLVREVP